MTDEEQELLAKYTKQTQTLVAKARIYIAKKAPYYLPVLLRLVPVYQVFKFSMAVSSTGLLILNPLKLATDEEFTKLDDEGLPAKLAGALVHECEHIIRDMRRVMALMKLHPEVGNIAADLAINGDLRRCGWELPNFVLYPEKYNLPESRTMEWYFDELMKDSEKARSAVERFDVGAGACGGAAGNSNDTEDDVANQNQQYAVPADAMTNAVNRTIQGAKAHYGSNISNAPNWVEQDLGELRRPPKRNWEAELRTVLQRASGAITAGGQDYSLSRRPLFSFPKGFLRSGLVDKKVEADLWIDTSGSMGAEELNHARELTCSFMESMGLDYVFLGLCDEKVTRAPVRTRVRDVGTLKMKGRRGTDFRPIFANLHERTPRPDLIVILTDGGGPAPSDPPHDIAVVWVIVPGPYQMKPTKWGHYVVCSNDQSVVDNFHDDDDE